MINKTPKDTEKGLKREAKKTPRKSLIHFDDLNRRTSNTIK